MKKLIILIVLTFTYSAMSQSLSVFDVDASNFPTIKAKFYAFAQDGNLMLNLNSSDFEVKEDGIIYNTSLVHCTTPKQERLSIVLLVDVTEYNDINNTKSVLNSWIDQLELGTNEVALVSYDGNSYINQDFTTDKRRLQTAINNLRTLSSLEDHDGAIMRPVTGGISVAEKGKYKKVVLLLSSCSHFHQTQIPLIIARANQSNVFLNFVIFDRYDWTSELTMQMALGTGGFSFNKIQYNDIETAKNSFVKIYHIFQNSSPCTIEWQSGITCVAREITTVDITLIRNGTKTRKTYPSPSTSIAKLEFNPISVKFENPKPGVLVQQKVSVMAKNADFKITKMTSSNADFDISPKNFVLNDGQRRELTVSYFPIDSGYVYAKFDIETDICPVNLYARGGWRGIKPKFRTIKLLRPNGGEIFVAGSDTVITWEGILPDEPVKIEYRNDNNQPWITVKDSATGFSHPFKVPNIISKRYLARVTSGARKISYCDNPYVEICGKMWMGCNLDVDHYRNGDAIKHAVSNEDWLEAGYKKEGAWCYYGNDPANGEIYGKLYNWYAVNDPRGLAPVGWRIPSDADWKALENCLGGTHIAGAKLKTTGTIEGGDGLWKSPNTGATNETDFSALPAGVRQGEGFFMYINYQGSWWSSTQYRENLAWDRSVEYKDQFLRPAGHWTFTGCSIRCIRD